jgi:hypothetical protein
MTRHAALDVGDHLGAARRLLRIHCLPLLKWQEVYAGDFVREQVTNETRSVRWQLVERRQPTHFVGVPGCWLQLGRLALLALPEKVTVPHVPIDDAGDGRKLGGTNPPGGELLLEAGLCQVAGQHPSVLRCRCHPPLDGPRIRLESAAAASALRVLATMTAASLCSTVSLSRHRDNSDIAMPCAAVTAITPGHLGVPLNVRGFSWAPLRVRPRDTGASSSSSGIGVTGYAYSASGTT